MRRLAFDLRGFDPARRRSDSLNQDDLSGAHGHDSSLPTMSAILYAAGPSIRNGGKLELVRNIDVASTIMRILGVTPAETVDGKAIARILKSHQD